MEDIRPLKDIVEIKGSFSVLPILITILAIAAIALFVYFNKKKKNKSEDIYIPQKTPREIALEELEKLLSEGLPGKGLIKEYYIKLSDIVRKFIEGKFNISTLDRTTYEIYRELRSSSVNRALVDSIRGLLEESDLVKFAKYRPNEKEAIDIFNRVKDIIEKE
ncbi:MAG: hypothetical protein ABIG92_00950 [Candidatus Omnitrophota bacterium]